MRLPDPCLIFSGQLANIQHRVQNWTWFDLFFLLTYFLAVHAITCSFQRLYRHGVAYLRQRRQVWIVWQGGGEGVGDIFLRGSLRYATIFPSPGAIWSRLSRDLTYIFTFEDRYPDLKSGSCGFTSRSEHSAGVVSR